MIYQETCKKSLRGILRSSGRDRRGVLLDDKYQKNFIRYEGLILELIQDPTSVLFLYWRWKEGIRGSLKLYRAVRGFSWGGSLSRTSGMRCTYDALESMIPYAKQCTIRCKSRDSMLTVYLLFTSLLDKL